MMSRSFKSLIGIAIAVGAVAAPMWGRAQQPQNPAGAPAQTGGGGAQGATGRGGGQGGGGNLNPDGSLRPAGVFNRLFTQEEYTEYSLLEPGSEAFRIRYILNVPRVGATEAVNATRAGSEGSDIEVYDPRTGKPLKFTYLPQANNPADHEIRATLPFAVPEGGSGRVLIYKTYKDARTYMMQGEDIVWVRSLTGYRLAVVLPKGYAFISSDVAAQLSTTTDGRLRIMFANPSGQSNPVTMHARKTTAEFPPVPMTDMFYDDVKTLYDLDAPETGKIKVEQTYSDSRKGTSISLDSLSYLAMPDAKAIDLDTGKIFWLTKTGGKTTAALEVPITDDKQSAHVKLTGTIQDGSYKVTNGTLTFERELRGLRNTVLLPAGWEVASVSQSGDIGTSQGRAFVALINLNAENAYRVTITARKGAAK